MGDCLHGNEFGVAEGCTRDNWAAEYAKKLFDVEASARKNADDDLQGNIEAEESARENADKTLDNRLTTAENNISKNAGAITAEESARENADKTLQGNIDKKQDASFDYSGYISVEEIARDAADIYGAMWGINNEFAGLPEVAHQVSRNTGAIQGLNARISVVSAGLSEEEETRSVAITALSDKISKQEIYSTTPTQVGWWVDGTPIWRVVFRKLGEDISTYMIGNTFQFDIREYLENNIIKSADDCRIINSAIFVGVEGSLEYEVQLDNGAYSYIKQKELSETQRYESNDVYGWIEFTSISGNFTY